MVGGVYVYVLSRCTQLLLMVHAVGLWRGARSLALAPESKKKVGHLMAWLWNSWEEICESHCTLWMYWAMFVCGDSQMCRKRNRTILV